jgi:hypothetical protein
MVLQDLFDTLAMGEFANLALANSVTGSIKEESYPRIVKAINRGLLEIYKKFIIKKKKVIIVQQADLDRYYLRTDYIGYSGSTGIEAYVLDHSDEIFLNDILRLLYIQDANKNFIDINPPHPGKEQTYFKSAHYDTLDLVTIDSDQAFTITYQAQYPKICITDSFDPENYKLYYPPFIEEALINYVASLLIKGKNTKASEGEGYASNTFAAKYELACLKILQAGLTEEVYEQDNRFEKRGFV